MGAKVDTSFNNMARGNIDHDMMGRYDLPIYQSGADLVQNFTTNFKGNAIYRSGFEDMTIFQNCVMVEFKFNNTQQYICLFYLNKIRFMSYDTNGNFGFVLNGGATPLEVATPYTLADCSDIQFTQNFDTMIVTQWNYEPQKLTRISANNFTFLPYSRKADPFPTTYATTKAITGITQASQANITIVGHGYVAGNRFRVLAVTGMTQINTWVVTVVSVAGANNVVVDLDTTNFTAYGANGTAELVTAGDYPHACCFYKGVLYYAATKLKGTTVFGSAKGNYYDHTLTPITDSVALQFTIADIAQRIEWLFKGDNSLIAGATDGIVAINGGAVNVAITASNIAATLTSAPPCNGAYPFKKDGLIFYVGTDGRNMYSFNYDILQELFVAEDANLLSYDITIGGITKLRWKKDKNDLIYCITNQTLNGDLLNCNFNKKENIIGWSNIPTSGTFIDEAVITDNQGRPQFFALILRNGNYYIERQAQYVEFARRVNFFTGTGNADMDKANGFEIIDDIAYNRYVAEQLKNCNYLDNSMMLSDLQNNVITFSGGNTITATANVFAIGDIGKHIVYKTLTGYESGRFEITGYTDAKNVTVSVLQLPTASVYQYWYRTFSAIGGLSNYNGTTISVVADGGYLADFAVTGGAIDMQKQVTSIWLGYKYKGIIKSFSLGFQIQGLTTQQTMKAINQFGVRCVASAGLKVGSSLYHVEPVQELSPDDINYLPPIPIDGTKYVQYTDDSKRDKYFYAVQDEPLPALIACIMVGAAYTVQT